MKTANSGPDIGKSALIIADMQNDFLHRDGNFSHIAREHPEYSIDMPFLLGTIPCAHGPYRAGCVGPHGGAVVRRPY